MAKAKVPQKSLPFVIEDLAERVSDAARPRVVEILAQMLIGAVLSTSRPQENDHEREDPADAS